MPYKDPAKQKAAQRKWYEDHQRTTVAERSYQQRIRVNDWLDSVKLGMACSSCGRICDDKYPPCVMDFHHRDESTKIFNVSAALVRASRQRVLTEIAKCDLVCVICHRMRHCTRHQH